MSTPIPLTIVILAAGKGTRMKSQDPKVLLEVGGKPMLAHVLDTVSTIDHDRTIVVVGHQAMKVKQAFLDQKHIDWVIQEPMRGTGHAIQCTREALADFSGHILVLYGDVPAMKAPALTKLIAKHMQEGNSITLLTAKLDNPTGYGRIVTDDEGKMVGIVEEKDASNAQKTITEVNTGIGVFEKASLMEDVFALRDDNAQGELYLTDVVSIAVAKGRRVGRQITEHSEHAFGINTPEQLHNMQARIQKENV